MTDVVNALIRLTFVGLNHGPFNWDALCPISENVCCIFSVGVWSRVREYSGLLNFPINSLTGLDVSMSLDGTVFAKGAGLQVWPRVLGENNLFWQRGPWMPGSVPSEIIGSNNG